MAVFLSRKKQILAGLAASPCENGEAWPAPGDCNPDDVVARPLPTPRSEVRPLFSGGGTESPLQEPGCKPDKSLKGCIDRDLIAVCGLINTSPAFVTTSSCSGRLTVFQQGDRRSGSNTKKGGKIVYASHSTVDVSEAARTIVDRIKSGRPHYQVRKDLALTTPGGDASRDERSHLSLSVPAVPPARQVLPAPRALVDQPLIDLKFEPFVIHVECVDLSSARALLAAALTSGLKHSGISSAGPKRYIVALRGSQRLEVPIAVPSGSPSIRTAESAATIAADAAVVSTVLLVTPEYLELLLQVCNAKLQLNLEQISRLHEALRKLADECGPEAEPNGRAKGAERVGVISLVKNRRHRRKTTKTTKPGLIDDSSASEVAAPLADSLHFGPASSASPVCSTDPSRSHPGAERSSCVSVSCRQLGVSGLLDRRQLHLWGCACALEYPHLCVFGGFSRSRRSDSLLVYNLETSRWDERRACSPPDGPGSRVWSSLLSLGAGFLLLLFGRRGPGDACSDCWVVDTTTWRWIPVLFSDTHLGLCSDDQEKRSSRTSSPCNGDALRHGELGGHGFSGEGTISWQSSMSSMGCTAGSSLSSSAAEKSFHAPELNTRPKGRWRHAACVESTSWTNVANGLRGLAHVWVYGGVNGAQPISDYILGDLWRLTLTVDVPKGSSRPLRAVGRWTLIPRQGDDAPPSLHSLSMVSSSTHLYLFGGVSQNDATSGDPVSLQVLYTFELASATWRRVVTAPDGTPSKSTLDVSGFSGALTRESR
ncbi:kelch repeat-containing protein [Cystoisospora suis]|uniref:tRNA(Phe) 7-[(3-amino-3-carboxypropyl)-4-demethylwyosine(37)-N(4)]-methyltransferase n=1 Tax=Cystoisospora suis TaxID=483139 RepID=A0A2C6KJ26_9APIC|nr:kelch repeat-containing protein [Cystoisospora suis]